MMESLVSVIIPCYNAAAYITETIDSVIAQTYSNIEIIVVDDGSTDASPVIIKNYSDNGRLTLVSQENAGVCAARNAGIAASKGDIIALLDADDWMYPDNISQKVNEMTKQDADMVFSWVEVTNDKLETQYLSRAADPRRFSDEVFVFAPPPVHSPSSVIIRKKALLEVGVFDTELGTSADLDMWIRLSFGHKMAKVEDALIKYRLVPGSMNTNVTGQIKDMNLIFQKYSNDKKISAKLKGLKRGFYYSILGNSYHTGNAKRFLAYLLKFARVSI